MKSSLIILFVLISAGLIFSGYLSAVKLLSGSCAFNETCPYFLGYPACWYGFAMYLVMFFLTGLGLIGKTRRSTMLTTDLIVSALGIVFAGGLAIREVGFSTCALGLIFYAGVFATALFIHYGEDKNRTT